MSDKCYINTDVVALHFIVYKQGNEGRVFISVRAVVPQLFVCECVHVHICVCVFVFNQK